MFRAYAAAAADEGSPGTAPALGPAKVIQRPQIAADLVQTIIGMARNLGLSVIAEGVETLAQRHALQHLDCQVFQGFLFGLPLPLQAFESWLAQYPAPLPNFPPATEVTANPREFT